MVSSTITIIIASGVICPLQERVPALWTMVRAAYKGVQVPKKLETELPDSFLGVLLLQYIKQVCAWAG